MRNQIIHIRIKRRVTPAIVALATLGVLIGTGPLHAQTNPRIIEFIPSAQHNTSLASGQPAVSRYELLIYQTNAIDPYLRLDLGKPAPQSDGVLRVDFSNQVSVWPLPNVSSDARVAAYGPGGVAVSGASSSFTFSCSVSVALNAQTFPATGGTGGAQITAGNQCGWSAASSASWLTVTTAAGGGSASVGYTVAASSQTASRTATLTIGDRTFTITQNAASVGTPAPVPVPPSPTPVSVTTYLSDRPWTSMVNGWGPAEKDRSNGEKLLADGKPITLNGQTYSKGLGVHSASDIRFPLNGTCSTFLVTVGVDDETGANGSVVFQVLADGVQLFKSGVMKGTTASGAVNVNITNRRELALIVTDAGDGAGSDHGDWADARLSCIGTPPPPTPSVIAFAEENGVVVAEAENADEVVARGGQSWTAQTNLAGFIGVSALQSLANSGKQIDTGYATTSPELRYRVRFTTPGTYHVWLRGYNKTINDNSVHVGLDGQPVASADRVTLAALNTWGWTKTTSDGPVATLSITTAGLHVINIWMREDGFYLDRLLLTNSSTVVPSGAGAAESRRQ